MERLAGKVAIVTGTGPNIGGTLAAGLAAEGAIVACNDIRLDAAEDAVERVVAAGSKAIAIPGDVTDGAFVEQAVSEVVDRFGRVDILINSAVRFNQKGVLTMPVEEYRQQLDIILSGAFLFTKHVAKWMIGKSVKGSIINVLSTAAWEGQPGNIGYCTGKSGLINFTRSAAMELAEHGIRVNGFTPTVTIPTDPEVLSKMMAQFQEAAALAATGGEPLPEYKMDWSLIPLGRAPTADDYVGAVVYLASDESAMITGTNITVDGGATAKYWPWIPSASTP